MQKKSGCQIAILLAEIICLVLIPIITVIIIVKSTDGINDFLVLKVIPVFLIIWCITLLLSIVVTAINYFRKRVKNNVKIVLYCISVALFLFCCFIELFSASIALGGFHAR